MVGSGLRGAFPARFPGQKLMEITQTGSWTAPIRLEEIRPLSATRIGLPGDSGYCNAPSERVVVWWLQAEGCVAGYGLVGR